MHVYCLAISLSVIFGQYASQCSTVALNHCWKSIPSRQISRYTTGFEVKMISFKITSRSLNVSLWQTVDANDAQRGRFHRKSFPGNGLTDASHFTAFDVKLTTPELAGFSEIKKNIWLLCCYDGCQTTLMRLRWTSVAIIRKCVLLRKEILVSCIVAREWNICTSWISLQTP